MVSGVGLDAGLARLATTLLPVVFPDGRPVGRHRVLAWVDGAAVAAVVIAVAAASWHLRGRR